jgi:hypothetical protein
MASPDGDGICSSEDLLRIFGRNRDYVSLVAVTLHRYGHHISR